MEKTDSEKMPSDLLRTLLSSKSHLCIKLLGDSITHGVGGTGFAQDGLSFIEGFARNPNGYCWANRFKQYMEEKYACSVVNNACTGTDIQFILRNFETLVDQEDDLILCTIGTNNRHRYFSSGSKSTREELGAEFYRNVSTLHRMFRETGKAVIFIANIPASAENEQDGEDYWRILHMDDINAIYKAAANKRRFPLISLYDRFSDYCRSNALTVDSLLGDGLHPNDLGYDVMYALLLEALGLAEQERRLE